MKDKALIGVSIDVEQPLDGALDPQEKPKKCHRILLGCFGNTSGWFESLCTFRAGTQLCQKSLPMSELVMLQRPF